MNSIFKILISVIIFGILLYFILSLFVLPKTDSYSEISKSIRSAMLDSGNPVCSKIDLAKNSSINTKSLLQTNLLLNEPIYIWFASLNPKLNLVVSEEFSNISTINGEKQLDYCAICFPKVVFSDYSDLSQLIAKSNIFCEVIFGKKLLPLKANFPTVYLTEQQGFKKISFNDKIPVDYTYSIYILNNENGKSVSKNELIYLNSFDTNIENKYLLNNTNKNDFNIEFKNAGEKIVLQALLQTNRNIFSVPILPMAFDVKSLNITPNDNYQMLDCKPTVQENQGKDYDLQKCLVYNYCEGCFLASHCAKVWQNIGVSAEAVASNYSKSYLPFDQC